MPHSEFDAEFAPFGQDVILAEKSFVSEQFGTVGREKDLIIRAGRNIYPTEIEDLIGELDGIRNGCVAVIGSPDPASGTERLVVLAETRKRQAPARAELRASINGIVTDIVTTNPYPEHYFVSGVPISPTALKKAATDCASHIFVFANLRFAEPDVKTMHIAARAMRLNPSAKIYVELVNPRDELTAHAPPGLMVMDSRALVRAILKNEQIDPER